MKIATFTSSPAGRPRLGALMETAEGPHLADLTAGRCLSERGRLEPDGLALAALRLPGYLRELLALGPGALDDARRALEHLTGICQRGAGLERLLEAGVLVAADEVRYLPAVARPGKVICAGMNYAEHVEESGMGEATSPERSTAFAKFPSALIGHGEPIVYPRETAQLDYEGELAMVIGRTASRVGVAQALDYVAGYTILNDVSSRDVQFAEMRAGMLLLGKNAACSSPLGPFLVTADEVEDPHGLALEVTVNGEIRQSGSTADLVFGCDELVSYWSATGLEPGDVISTGTPSGVGIFRDPPERYLLKPGDVVEVAIDGLGVLRNAVEAPTDAIPPF